MAALSLLVIPTGLPVPVLPCLPCASWSGLVDGMACFPPAAAVYTEEGQKQIQETIAYYMRNAKIIREGLTAAGITVFGGVDAPYIWLKVPAGMDSWTFFDRLLDECHIVGTPGSGFGPSGEGYFRLTAFNTLEKTEQAVERIRSWKI